MVIERIFGRGKIADTMNGTANAITTPLLAMTDADAVADMGRDGSRRGNDAKNAGSSFARRGRDAANDAANSVRSHLPDTTDLQNAGSRASVGLQRGAQRGQQAMNGMSNVMKGAHDMATNAIDSVRGTRHTGGQGGNQTSEPPPLTPMTIFHVVTNHMNNSGGGGGGDNPVDALIEAGQDAADDAADAGRDAAEEGQDTAEGMANDAGEAFNNVTNGGGGGGGGGGWPW